MGVSHVVVKKGVYNYSGRRGRFWECRLFRGGGGGYIGRAL